MAFVRDFSRYAAVTFLFACLTAVGYAQQFPEQNINMVSGTQWPGGDPFLRQQNEPSMAVSTRNPLHLLAGANDYRSVDIPFNAPARPDEEETGDAWLGVFRSKDGGNKWTSILLDGYPQQTNTTSPLKGFQAAADPVVRAGRNGMFYYAGIVLNRGSNPLGGVFVARFIDNNNTDTGDPVAYLDTKLIDQGTAGQFIDKPWFAVAPMTNGGQCTVSGQSFPAQNLYLAYSVFVGNDNNIRTKIMFTRSTDCGATWASPQKLSESYTINQGVNVAVDPVSGAVYVAWRRFHGGNEADSIIIAKSTNGGGTFTKGSVVTNITPFEQGTGTAAIRTNAYPAIAVDNNGRVYIAWSQRTPAPATLADPNPTDGRIVMINSGDGLTNWSSPMFVSPAQGGTSAGRGSQFMPAMTFSSGKLTLVWYDLRDDQTIAGYTKPSPFDGNYLQSRILAGNLFLGQPQVVFWTYLADVSPIANMKLVRRHTLDVYATESANLGVMLSFNNSARVTRYKFGALPPSYSTIQDFQINPPNLPMFRQGTVPFIGDYIDLAAYSATPTSARVRHIVWTDNRDVRAPLGTPPDWTKYTPVQSPSLGAKSIFDPTQTPPVCTEVLGNALNAGSRNQNIYTTRVTDGLFAGSPRNAKSLGNNITRSFVVFVQNSRSTDASYQLAIVPPSAGTASFLQFSILGLIDVQVPAHSTSTRTVFVNAPPLTRVDVNISENVPNGGLGTVVTLNGDPTNPDIGNPDIGNNEIFNPDIGNPDIGNPDIGNPDIGNPDIGNPDIGNPDIGNPDIGNPDIGNPDIGNPDIGNPDIGNPDIGNGSVTDTTWGASNEGNTTGGYTVKLLQNQPLPQNLKTQLIINKIYDTPAARGCNLGVEHNRQIVTSVNNLPLVTNPSDLNNPSLNVAANASTLWLAPGEKGRITVRLIDPINKGLTLDASAYVTPVAISHSVNTADVNSDNQTPPISLTILTNSLPDGMGGEAYAAPLSAIGGRGTRTWSATGLPAGLAVTGSSITGTPQSSGTFNVTISVTDQATPLPHTKSKTLSLTIIQPLAVTSTSLPDGTIGKDYAATITTAGGVAPRILTVAPLTGALGLSFDGAAGVLSGVPALVADQDLTFTVTDSTTPVARTASKVLTIHVRQPLFIGTESIPVAIVGQPYSTTIGVTGGQPPYLWDVKGPTPPLSIDQNGVLSGTFTQPNSSFVTVSVTDSGNPVRFAQQQYNFSAVSTTITAITPSTAAAGIGQMVAIDVVGLSSLDGVSVTFNDGSTTNTGFLFGGPSTTSRLFVRLPTGLNNVQLTVGLVNGGTTVATSSMTLSSTPGTPTIQSVYGLATPPDPNSPCGGGQTASPVTSISAGEGILVSALGVDTTQSQLRFSQSGQDDLFADTTCAVSSPSLGLAPVFTAPSNLIPGPVDISVRVRVGDFTSDWSAPVRLNVNASSNVDLAPLSAGSIIAGQSFNETRLAEIVVEGTSPVTVSSMTLAGLNANNPATVGARIYDANWGLVSQADVSVNLGRGQTVTIPISAVLTGGATYRVGFSVVTNPTSGGSGDFLIPTGWPTAGATPYEASPSSWFTIQRAWDLVNYSPSNPSTNLAVPQMTITATR